MRPRHRDLHRDQPDLRREAAQDQAVHRSPRRDRGGGRAAVEMQYVGRAAKRGRGGVGELSGGNFGGEHHQGQLYVRRKGRRGEG